MASHRYKPGQIVSLSGLLPDRTRGHVEIVRLMPASQDGEFHYRVRGSDKIERAIGESQIAAPSPGSSS